MDNAFIIILICIPAISILIALAYFLKLLFPKLYDKFRKKNTPVRQIIGTIGYVHLLNGRKPPYSKKDEVDDVKRFDEYMMGESRHYLDKTKFADLNREK